MMIDYSSLVENRWEALWNGLVLLSAAFIEAASANPWMWIVAAIVALMASRRAWFALLRNVGLAYLRGSSPGSP